MFRDDAKIEFQWLDATRAAAITEIAKRHGATVRRVAQGRGMLGKIKVVATVNKGSAFASATAAGAIKAECRAAGLVNELTF